jgi:hypothetical protein
MGTASLAHGGEVIRLISEERAVCPRRNPVLPAALQGGAMSARRGSRPSSFSVTVTSTRRNGRDQCPESATDQGETGLLSRPQQRPPEILQHCVTPELFDQLQRVA